MGDFLMTGEYQNTLDEKGRILFPAKVRSELPDNKLIITKGIDKCLLIFTPEKWELFSTEIMNSASVLKSNFRSVVRRLIGPAQEVEMDKAGRLSIPQSLRSYANLEKDCLILGLNKYFELWNVGEYDSYLESSEPDFLEAVESLGDIGF